MDIFTIVAMIVRNPVVKIFSAVDFNSKGANAMARISVVKLLSVKQAILRKKGCFYQ